VPAAGRHLFQAERWWRRLQGKVVEHYETPEVRRLRQLDEFSPAVPRELKTHRAVVIF